MHCARYTVASRDIPACQLILREAPVVHGPYTKTTPVCLSCYAKVRELIGFVYKLRSGGMGCFPKWFQYRKGVCLWGTQKVIKQLSLVSFIKCSHEGIEYHFSSSPMQTKNWGEIWSGLDPQVLQNAKCVKSTVWGFLCYKRRCGLLDKPCLWVRGGDRYLPWDNWTLENIQTVFLSINEYVETLHNFNCT